MCLCYSSIWIYTYTRLFYEPMMAERVNEVINTPVHPRQKPITLKTKEIENLNCENHLHSTIFCMLDIYTVLCASSLLENLMKELLFRSFVFLHVVVIRCTQSPFHSFNLLQMFVLKHSIPLLFLHIAVHSCNLIYLTRKRRWICHASLFTVKDIHPHTTNS